MKHPHRKHYMPVAATVVVALLAPSIAPAAWRSQELPGLVSGKQVAVEVLVTVGAVVGVAILYAKVFRKPAAPVTLTPKKPDLGTVKIRDEQKQEIVILNDGKAPISFVAASISGETFMLGSTPAAGNVLKPGQTMRLQVSAKPTHTGKQQGTLTLVFKDSKGKERAKKTPILLRAIAA